MKKSQQKKKKKKRMEPARMWAGQTMGADGEHTTGHGEVRDSSSVAGSRGGI